MKNPLSAFSRWRLTSGAWQYLVLAIGWGSCWGGAAALSVVSAWIGILLIGLGLFLLCFEVGLTDIALTAKEGMRIRQIRGDAELLEKAMTEARDLEAIEKRFRRG